jgi:hypothetical protein
MAVECTMTAEDLKKAFTFKEAAPFVTFNVPEKYQTLYKHIEEWMELYAASITKLDFMVEELVKIP